MQAGKLRSKIDILRLVEIKDQAGGVIGTWVTHIPKLRCEDKVISTRAALSGSLQLENETHTIRVRAHNDILPTDRVRLSDGRELAIDGYPQPDDSQKGRFLIITAVYDGKSK